MELSLPLKVALSDFIINLQKGLIDDERWDWDVEETDWKEYQQSFLDPTILRTTIAIWMNTIRLSETGEVIHSTDAAFRAFQYFRSMFDRDYSHSKDAPKFEMREIEEPY
jgi:hypothetical protein